MDLSIPIAAGIVYLAYNLTDKQNRNPLKKRQTIAKHEKFSGKNIYESTRYDEVNKEIQDKANKAFVNSSDYKNTNRIPPFMNSICYEDCDQKTFEPTKTSILPLTTPAKKKKIVTFDKVIPVEKKGTESEVQTKPNEPLSLLTGKPIELKHNNMVPFFSGEVKQNTDIGSEPGLIERFTGKLDTPTLKTEIPSMFDKKPENIHGMPLFTNEISRDRFYQSGIKNNVGPTPQIKVKPLPEEVVRPIFKPVEELRVKTNPKNEYKGRVITGQNQSTTQRGIEGKLRKNKPETHFEINSDRYFSGSYINAQTTRENFNQMKDTNRSQEENYIAPGKDQVTRNPFQLRSEGHDDFGYTISSDPFKSSYENEPFRNLSGEGKAVTDYGKCSFVLPQNERDTTSKQHILNVSDTKLGNYLYSPDDARTTQKELNLYSYTGNPEKEVKNLTNRVQYQNYRTSLKEETLSGYQPGPQNQHDYHGAESVNLTTCKNNNTFNDYKGHFNPTYESFNNDCGKETTNNLRCISGHDFSERLSSDYIKSLESNPYELRRKFSN